MDSKFLQALKEVAKYLGDKLDTGFSRLSKDMQDSKQHVSVDIGAVELELTTRAVKELQASSDLTVNKIGGVLEDIAKKEQAHLTALVSTITKLKDSLVEKDSDVIEKQILLTLQDIEETQRKLLDSEANEDVCDEIRKAVGQIVAAVKGIELEESEDDYTPLINELKRVTEGLADLKATVRSVDNAPLIKELLGAIKGLKLEFPKTFKLDDTQLRSIRSGGTTVVGGSGAMTATNVETANVALTATNTQYSYTFPANTLSWTLKLRAQGVLGYYSYTTGTLPAVGGGGTGSNYVTIPQNFLQSAAGVEWSGKTIYLGAASASQVAEITVFTM